jgi:hypothetical protein
MSTIKVDTITKADGTNSISQDAIITTSSPQLGRRNLIINGAMQVWQRGTSRTGINTAPFVADRFWSYAGTSTGSIERSTDVPSGEGFVYSYYNNTNVTAYSGTNIELNAQGNASPFYNGQTLTFSFWVKAPSASSSPLYINWRNAHASGADSTAAADNGIFNWTTSWSRQVMTFTLYSNPVANNRVLDLEFLMPSGAKITGVQLEVGSVATPFEHRSYGEELALCQRYYYQTGTSGYTGIYGTTCTYTNMTQYHEAYGVACSTVEMRTAPSITTYDTEGTSGKVSYYISGAGSSGKTATVHGVSSTRYNIYSDNTTSKGGMLWHFRADAEL